MMKLYSVVVSVPFNEWDWLGLEQWVDRFKNWHKLQSLKEQVAKERQDLAELPDYILKDIGVTAGDAYLESQRKFDDLPKKRIAMTLRNGRCY
ncbi:MAG: DUF1127 domain-containing protein [Thiothrix sp.]|nr:MAG: DUF1127 domain-containing protein [Thiothrix sp.]